MNTLDVAQDRRWCMPEDVPCDVCGASHQDVIDPVEKVEQDTAHTGLRLIQQERLRAHTELAQYRLDLASVKGTCLLCRAVKSSWDHDFSTCDDDSRSSKREAKPGSGTKEEGGNGYNHTRAASGVLTRSQSVSKQS